MFDLRAITLPAIILGVSVPYSSHTMATVCEIFEKEHLRPSSNLGAKGSKLDKSEIAILERKLKSEKLSQANLVIEITNIRERKGAIRVGIWHSDEANNFTKELEGNCIGCSYFGEIETNGRPRVFAIAQGISAGDYAIAAYHDSINNDELNMRSYLLISEKPDEDVGISGDARGSVFNSSPPFASACFEIKDEDTRIVIELVQY